MASATTVTTGYSHSCANRGGYAWCWGNNQTDQVFGQGYPSAATYFGHVGDLDAGHYHTCAVVNGGVQCWGGNSMGQLGLGFSSAHERKTQVVPEGSNVTKVSAGYGYNCAIADGGLLCWGGYNAPIGPQVVFAPNSGVTQVDVSLGHQCAVKNGGLYCWGGNESYQLGIGNTQAKSVPTLVIAEGLGVTKVAAGFNHTCVVKNGGRYCWGRNTGGVFGLGGAVSNSYTILSPRELIPEGSGVSDVSAGAEHSCVIKNGGIKCWGNLDSLYSTIGDVSLGGDSGRQLIPENGGATSISGYNHHFCAVVQGRAQCLGSNKDYALGQSYLPNGAFIWTSSDFIYPEYSTAR